MAPPPRIAGSAGASVTPLCGNRYECRTKEDPPGTADPETTLWNVGASAAKFQCVNCTKQGERTCSDIRYNIQLTSAKKQGCYMRVLYMCVRVYVCR